MAKKYKVFDFYTDVYNILVLLPESEKQKKYVRRAAFFLTKYFLKRCEYLLAAKMREVVKSWNKKGII